ncbi:eukaryotic translation elongation factor 1 delta a (guanine nucleotide exchange protein) isoform X1 [Epinephelus lanceolatus]|uniref:eukaryotic translation elongation factor 1 delta a (guanine nucleotide exchange protein) isoform X2 n=1 Tax=Epinephelus lanceolatus TaxID=310571 RepID=UPI001444DE67|nr:eukaryotic translation elongation factor 1 delta a (guanine nucleotide exchange protein) isoform X2 [Epinephelus lanceolatus]
MDQSWPNRQQGGVPQHAIPMGAFRQGNNPTMERAISSGDKVQFERLRRRTRVSESSGAEEEWLNTSMEASGSYGQSPTFHTMHAEGNLYSRSPFEHAEENYKRWLASNTNGAQSASPRSPTTRGYMTFQSRRSRTQQQDQGHHVTTVKASGTPHRLITRGRNRTSSETEQGGKGSRGPTQRKRGFSETESRPRWDNTNMSGLQCLASENIWFDKHRYDEAERRFYEGVNGPSQQVKSTLQHAKGRQQKRQHRNSSSHAGGDQELVSRMKSMELENQTLHKVVAEMRAALLKLESRVAVLEKNPAAVPCAKAVTVQAAPAKQVKVENGGDDEDDDIDLFGSDEEDEEAARIKQERLDAYAAKKSKKPALIAKSSILLDVKPWDDETDMAKLEECVRSVQMDGLLWGASKLVPVGYGIKKLQINCVVEDDKVGTDILEEEITKFEDYVQSVDVAAFNKI